MALVAGCRYGIPQVGGQPRQCGQAVSATIRVKSIYGADPSHTLDVCAEHYQSFRDRRRGTEYTEVVPDVPAPKAVMLVTL